MDFIAWLADTEPIDPAPRAVLEMNAIYDKGTFVVFKTDDGIKLAPQLLRLEYDNSAADATSDAGVGAERKLIIFGVKDHPTLPNSDMDEGYRFTFELHEYRIVSVIGTLGELQASAERV